jgi:hypothetical protein
MVYYSSNIAATSLLAWFALRVTLLGSRAQRGDHRHQAYQNQIANAVTAKSGGRQSMMFRTNKRCSGGGGHGMTTSYRFIERATSGVTSVR